MWPYFVYDLENAQFHHSFRNLVRTSGWKIYWSPNLYFSNQCKKCFNLRYYLNNLSQIFLFQIVTVRDVKIFLTVSRDLSTDKQQRGIEHLSKSTWSDKSPKKECLNSNCWNGPRRKFLTHWQFPDLPIEFCEKRPIEHVSLSSRTRKIQTNWQFLEPVKNGSRKTFFGYPHKHWFWWRHRYDSYLLNFRIKCSDGELTELLKTFNIIPHT